MLNRVFSSFFSINILLGGIRRRKPRLPRLENAKGMKKVLLMKTTKRKTVGQRKLARTMQGIKLQMWMMMMMIVTLMRRKSGRYNSFLTSLFYFSNVVDNI